jgi:ribosome biogenesis protein Nip4
MKLISDFISKFSTNLSLDQDLLIKKRNRYFLLNKNLRHLIKEDFFYAGTYLGKAEGKTLFPSFNLLAMIAQTDANKMTVDAKTEWLFICGRDIFRRGIIRRTKSPRKGAYTLVLNSHGECLGFGKTLHNMDDKDTNKITVKNIADIGDFLRREK